MKRIVLFVLLIIMTTAVMSSATWPDPAVSKSVTVVDQHRYDKPLLFGLVIGALMFSVGFVGMWILASWPTLSNIASGMTIGGVILMVITILTAICTIAASPY